MAVGTPAFALSEQSVWPHYIAVLRDSPWKDGETALGHDMAGKGRNVSHVMHARLT